MNGLSVVDRLAGSQGFEPWYAEIKTPCLTAWRRPNFSFLQNPNLGLSKQG